MRAAAGAGQRNWISMTNSPNKLFALRLSDGMGNADRMNIACLCRLGARRAILLNLTLLLGHDGKFHNQSQSSEIDRPLIHLQMK